MILDIRSFSTLVRQQAAVIQSQAAIALDFSVGSVIRAWIEAVAGTALLLQKQALDVLRTTRLASSTNSDVDSFVADFGYVREPATPATGQVTFYLSGAVFIPVGATVKTADLSLTFTVQADPTITGYSSTLAGYSLPGTVPTVALPVVCTTVGKGGNILPQAISLMGTALPGVNSVTNLLAIENGADAQTDASVRRGFQKYLASLARATITSVENAIDSVQQGLTYEVLENTLPNGATRAGTFTIVLDDGSGTPSSTLMNSVYAAVDAVRPLGSAFSIIAPTVIPVGISCNVTVSPGASLQAAQATIGQAVSNYINGLAVGDPVLYLKIAAITFGASSTVTDIENLLVNNGTANLPGAVGRVYKAGGQSIA